MKLKLRIKHQDDGGKRWPLRVGLGAVTLLLLTFYGLHLGSLVPASPAEQATVNGVQHLGTIMSNPLLAPYKLLAWVGVHMPGSDLLNVRLTSVVVTLLCAALFYSLARRWHGRLVGATATVLFALSGWTLATGRQATAFMMLTLSVLALIGTAVLINKAKDSQHADKAVLAFTAAIALALTTPGGIWFALATVLVVGKQLLGHAKLARKPARLGALAIILIGVGIFVATGLQGSSQLHQALALPSNMPDILTFAKQAALSVTGLIVRGPYMPTVWLSHTPLLDIASSVMLLLGAILYVRHIDNSRARLLLAFTIVGIVITALNGAIALSYLLPIVYLVIASGLAYFFHQWRKVFPRNPVANATAIVILGVVVLSIVSFHAQRYFVAWRYSPDTQQAYRQPQAEDGRQDAPYLIQ